MKPIYHIAVSSVLGVALINALHSWPAGISCLLGGVFIDLDHHLDYFIEKKEIPLSYRKLFDYGANDKKGKLYLFLHSYELLLMFWLAIYYFQLNPVWLGLAVGVTVHIVCDQFANPMRPLAYFLVYRIKYGFERKNVFKEDS